MFKNFLTAILTLGMAPSLFAQTSKPETNLSEAAVPAYTLPDPLRTANGRQVTTAQQWNRVQRPYIYRLFETNVYGRFPRKPVKISFTTTAVDHHALNGLATRKQVTVYFTQADTTAQLQLLLYLPNKVKGPAPVFLGMNFYGNQSVENDTAILINRHWMVKGPGVTENHATEASRGAQASQWPLQMILSRGYGLATFFCGDVEEDNPEGWKTGIRTKLEHVLQIRPDEWSAIGVWGWAMGRALDYLEKDPGVNAKQVIITGHSRLGKAALWGAASDPRFAMVISNESGEGGAALSKRWYGETVKVINRSFPHWFCATYKKYGDNTDALPVDQHMLLSLMAPRPLYVASAQGDQWSDPKGEFLSAKNAEPVYRLFGEKGLGIDSLPPLNQPAGNFIRYHIRDGKHDVTDYDWQQYLQFADEYIR